MAFFNIFKKKPTSAAPPPPRLRRTGKDTTGKEEAPASPASLSRERSGSAGAPTRRIVGVSSLSLPHISEKAGMLQAQNQYVFKVIPGATKYGVKASVEEQYGVLVEKVAMIRVPAKSIRVGKRMGERQGYKKAVVTLKKGYKIETSA